MKILGIDPGTRVLGYGLIDDDGRRFRLLDSGCVRAVARRPLSERLHRIGDELRGVLERLRPDVVAIEQAFYGRNVAALIALGEGRGVVLYCAAALGVPIHEYSPAEVKKAVTGRGGARKESVGEMVRALVAGVSDARHDVTDALAVAVCHAQRRHLLAAGEAFGAAATLLRAAGRGRVRRGRGR